MSRAALVAHAIPPRARATHVAVLLRPYLDAILDGRKTVEARLSMTRRVPFGVARAGDLVYFKQRSGPVRAVATIARADYFDNLTPARIAQLRAKYGRYLHADGSDYWDQHARARYAAFLWLEKPRSADKAPRHRPFYGDAWQVLKDVRSSSPLAGEVADPPRRNVSLASRLTGEGSYSKKRSLARPLNRGGLAPIDH